MALDDALLAEVSSPHASPHTYLRFYQWVRPTLSLGFSQRPARVVDLDYCNLEGIDVVRRPTGGKAVLHHHELTYSVASNDPAFFPIADISRTYNRIALALQSGFRFLGIETTLAGHGRSARAGPLSVACFAVSNHHEVLWSGRKLVGSAQRRTKNAFLQHGSILIEFDAERLSRALRVCNPDSVRAAAADLKSCLGTIPPVIDLISAMSKGFEVVFGATLAQCALSQHLSAKALELVNQKYAVLNGKHSTVSTKMV